MSASPKNPDPPRKRALPVRLILPAVALLAVAGVVIYRQHVKIMALQAQVCPTCPTCPSDVFPRDSALCGHDGAPACGVAAWMGGKCRVTELKSGIGCGGCYAGQVSPCLLTDYRQGCDGESSTCGVRYCKQTTTGSWDYEDLCRPIGAPPP
jgi:hypothetical protein